MSACRCRGRAGLVLVIHRGTRDRRHCLEPDATLPTNPAVLRIDCGLCRRARRPRPAARRLRRQDRHHHFELRTRRRLHHLCRSGRAPSRRPSAGPADGDREDHAGRRRHERHQLSRQCRGARRNRARRGAADGRHRAGARPAGRRYDARTFHWIGRINSNVEVQQTWHTAAVKTIADAKTHEVVVGGTGPDSSSVVFPRILNAMFGMKFKVVAGLRGRQHGVDRDGARRGRRHRATMGGDQDRAAGMAQARRRSTSSCNTRWRGIRRSAMCLRSSTSPATTSSGRC